MNHANVYINARSKVHQGIVRKENFVNGKWDENGMMIMEKCGDYEDSSPPQLNRLHALMQHSVGCGRAKGNGAWRGNFQNIQVSI